MRIALFLALLIGATLYAIVRGGKPERLAGIAMLLAAVASFAVRYIKDVGFVAFEFPHFLIDCALLAALAAIAVKADRYWPLWLTALHGVTTYAHALRLIDPTILPRAYAIAIAAMSYPMVLILILATWRHQQRIKHFGHDPSWSRSLSLSEPRTAPEH